MVRSGCSFAAVVLLALASGARAQQSASQAVQAQDQAALAQDVQGGVSATTITSTESFAPASPADADLGEQVVLQPEQRYQPFSAWTNWNVFWTNNAELLDDTQGSDTFMTGTVGGAYLPQLGGNLFLDLSVEQSIYRYAQNADLDFNGTQLRAGLVYVVRPLGDLTLFSHYEYDLLTARGLNREIYSAHVWSTGARKVFSLNRANLFYTSAAMDFTLGGEPTYALRNEFNWLLGYQLALTRQLKLDLYYRLSAQAYRTNNRADFNQLVGGGLTFEVTRWLSVQAITTLGINRSTEETYNYFAANLGGGLGILVNF